MQTYTERAIWITATAGMLGGFLLCLSVIYLAGVKL